MIRSLSNLSTRNWIKIGTVGLAVLIIGIIWAQFSLYTITVSSDKQPSITSVNSANGVRKKPLQLFGIYIISRDSSFIEVTQGQSVTRVGLLNHPIFSIKHVDITVESQRSVDKIGRQGLGCTITHPAATYTYRCDTPTAIVQFSDLAQSRWKNNLVRELSNDPLFFGAAQYKDGLLRGEYLYENGETGKRIQLHYIRPDSVETKSATVDIPYTLSDNLVLVGDRNGGDTIGLVNASTGAVRLLSNLDTQARSYQRTIHYNTLTDFTTCAVFDQTMACYYGANSISPHEEADKQALQQSRTKRAGAIGGIEQYNTSQEATRLSRLYTSGLDQICLSNDRQLVGRSGRTLFSFNVESDTLPATILADDATQLSCGTTAIYGTEQSIYRIDGSSSYQMFSSNRLDISTISSFGQHITFDSFISPGAAEQSDNIIHTYRINLSRAADTNRKEDKLPYLINSTLPLFDMDYQGNIIYIQPSYAITSDHETGQVIVDTDSFEAAKRQIQAKLDTDGFTTDAFTIVYSAD